MKLQPSHLLFLFLSLSTIARSQLSTSLEAIDKITIDTIPFTLTDHNNIIIEAVLNKADTLNLMFHTAVEDISIIKDATEGMKSLLWNEIDSVESWGGKSTSRSSSDNKLTIGDFDWENLNIWECEASGPLSDGKFGPNLFNGKVIEILFDQELMVIHDVLPAKVKNYDRVVVSTEYGFMFIKGVSIVEGQNFTNKYLIHSGYKGTILYDNEFANSSKIGDHVEIIDQKELTDSYGNIIKVLKGKLPQFQLGNQFLKDIPVGFFEGGRQSMSVLGGDVLKRFNLIIDLERDYIYLKPNKLMNAPFS